MRIPGRAGAVKDRCSQCRDTAVLCSVHFTPDCLTRRLDLTNSNENLSSHRHLERGSIPTIDVAVEQANPASVTDRERRIVSET